MFKTPIARFHDYAELPNQIFAGVIQVPNTDRMMAFAATTTGESTLDAAIYRLNSSDGGNTWGPPELFVDSDVGDGFTYPVYHGDTLYFFYMRHHRVDNLLKTAWYRTSTDHGDTWSDDVHVPFDHNYWGMGQPMIDSGSNIVVPYYYLPAGEAGSHDGTYTGTVTLNQTSLISGSNDPCVKLDGTSGWVSVGSSGMNMNTTNWTAVMWIKMSSTPLAADRLQILMDKTGTSAANGQYWMAYENRSSQGSPQRLMFAHGNATAATASWDNADAELAAGGMAAFVCGTDGKLRIYWNGVLKATSPGTVPSVNASNALALGIGRHSTASSFFLDAFVDDTAFFLSALSEAEILALYNAGSTEYGVRDAILTDTSLEAYWRFDETTGTTANDIIGSNDGYYRSGVLIYDPDGDTWTTGDEVPVQSPDTSRGLIEPHLAEYDDLLYMYCRNTSGMVFYSTSSDGGLTWADPASTLHAGTDSLCFVRHLSDGRIIMANHPSFTTGQTKRRPLCLFLLDDPLEFATSALQIVDSSNDVDTDKYIIQSLEEYVGGTYDGYLYGSYWYQNSATAKIDAHFFRLGKWEFASTSMRKTHAGVLWVDGFNATALGSLGNGYTKTEGLGVWRIDGTGTVATYNHSSDTPSQYMVRDVGTADVAMIVQTLRSSNGTSARGAGPVFRYSDSNNLWNFDNRLDVGLRLWKVVASTATVIDTDAEATTDDVFYRMQVLCSGNNITVYRGGAQKFTTTSADNNSNTMHGVHVLRNQAQYENLCIMESFEIKVKGLRPGEAVQLKESVDVAHTSATADSSGTATLTCILSDDTDGAIDFPRGYYLQVYTDDTYTTPVTGGRYPDRGTSLDIFGGDVYEMPPRPTSLMV